MNGPSDMTTPRLPLYPALLALLATTLLSACGGGGKESVVPTVSSASARPTGSLTGGEGTGTYGQKVLITVNGSALDNGVTALSNGCTGITRLTTAPTESTATTAFFECTISTSGTVQVGILRDSSGLVMATVPITVPDPQVSLSIGNGSSTLGTVVLTLLPARAPVTVSNFMDYVRSGFYVGTVFHRHSPNFVMQGGGYAGPLDPGNTSPTPKTTSAAIALEDNAGLSNLRGTVAMARTNAPNSATSQFFFNLVDNTFLDRTPTARGYAVFANVTAGSEVITAMRAAPCVSYTALLPAGDCLPQPNLVVTAATQTR
jgi:cyclophilin family peptidyl-prolyl cis-trans isomerase